MKASKLIKKLEAVIELYGDATVEVHSPKSDELFPVNEIHPVNTIDEPIPVGNSPTAILLKN